VIAVHAAIILAMSGRPADVERWAQVAGRWRDADAGRRAAPAAGAWTALLRAILCQGGIERMRADADEAARRFAAEDLVSPGPALYQGLARVLSGDPDGGDAYLADAVRIAEKTAVPNVMAVALCERALVALADNQWDRAEALAGQARAVVRWAGTGESLATPLICVVRARTALHRGDAPAVRQHLVHAQRLRILLTYALPHLAVQARIGLTRVHLALADLAAARTLMREIDELLRRRPGLGTLTDEAEALRAQLAKARGSSIPGASALTTAELQLLPLLPTHLPVAKIAAELFLSPHTIKSRMNSIYRKLDASTRDQAVTRARELGLLEG
jgi:LuxR family maltose regulon positive regulatory protein